MTLPPQPQPVHEPTPQRAPIFALVIITALFALLLIGWMKMDSTAPVTPAVIEQVPPATDPVPAPTTPPAP